VLVHDASRPVVAWIGQPTQQQRFQVEAMMKIKRSARGRTDAPWCQSHSPELRSAPWTGNEPYFCGLLSFPAARIEYGSCDIQREPALEITSRKNYLEGG
jgi:hypothetical protein